MAGLPASLLARAGEILALLEGGRAGGAAAREELAARPVVEANASAVVSELATLDPDELTPLEALSALYALRERARLALGEEEA